MILFNSITFQKAAEDNKNAVQVKVKFDDPA